MKRPKAKRVLRGRNFGKWFTTLRHANAGARRFSNILGKHIQLRVMTSEVRNRCYRFRVMVAIIVCSLAKHSTEPCMRKNFFPAFIEFMRKADPLPKAL